MSPSVQIPSALVILVLIAPLIFSAALHNLRRLQTISVDERYKRAATRLFKSSIGDDGLVYACSEKNFYAFESNGSIAWSVYLKYTCDANIAPVHRGSKKIYLVAEKRVLKLYPLKVGTSEPAVEVFFGPAQGKDGPGEIIGISASISSSCVLITIKDRGLFAYGSHGKLIWSAGPVLYQHGYRQGCRKNITECYFTSPPVIDHCEASVFIFNTVGELYSLTVRGPYFKWIRDLSSFGNTLTITPGNDGLLYVIVPESALVLALNASTGNILWQGSFGALSSTDYEPVVDANGWISFGSLDGYLYSFSPTGDLRKFPRSPRLDSVIQVNPILDCSGYALYISETEMEAKTSQTIAEYTYVSALKPKNVAFTLLVPASGSHWSERDPSTFLFKLSQSDLQRFVLDEVTLLTFFAASRIGNPFPCHSTNQRLAQSCLQVNPESATIYTGNEKTVIVWLIIESIVLLLLAAALRFCCIFWKKKRIQDHHLGKFLEKRRCLQSQEREYDQMITELEQKPSDEAVLATLNDLFRGREHVKRRLSTTYNLGRDTDVPHAKSLLPLYNGTTRSHSFRSSGTESVSIFHSVSESGSSSGEYSSPITKDQYFLSEDGDGFKPQGKAPAVAETSSGGKRGISCCPSASGGSVNSLFLKNYSSREIEEVSKKEDDEEERVMGDEHSEGGRLRRRTMPITN